MGGPSSYSTPYSFAVWLASYLLPPTPLPYYSHFSLCESIFSLPECTSSADVRQSILPYSAGYPFPIFALIPYHHQANQSTNPDITINTAADKNVKLE